MTVHELSTEQFVPRPKAEVFAFFSRPENLARITSPDMRFELSSQDRVMRAGLRLTYRLRPLLSIPTIWVSEITRYDAPDVFVDVQVRGPYTRWEHIHTFEEARMGDVSGTRITDSVTYELPFGPLGDLVNALLVRRRLAAIFAYRRRAIERLLPRDRQQDTPRRIAVASGSPTPPGWA